MRIEVGPRGARATGGTRVPPIRARLVPAPPSPAPAAGAPANGQRPGETVREKSQSGPSDHGSPDTNPVFPPAAAFTGCQPPGAMGGETAGHDDASAAHGLGMEMVRAVAADVSRGTRRDEARGRPRTRFGPPVLSSGNSGSPGRLPSSDSDCYSLCALCLNQNWFDLRPLPWRPRLFWGSRGADRSGPAGGSCLLDTVFIEHRLPHPRLPPVPAGAGL